MLKFTKFMPKLCARCLMVVVYKCNKNDDEIKLWTKLDFIT